VSYAQYIKDYDRKAFGHGSDRDPAVDRFSGKDIRKMFRAGFKDYDKSRAEAAQMVLDYAKKVKGKTKMGDTAKKALDKLRKFAKETEPEKPKGIPTQPIEDKPKEVQEAVEEYEESKLELPENQQPKMSELIEVDEMGTPTSDPSLDAIKHGDDLNEWYQTKFVPHLEAEAHAGAHEIGNASRYFLDKWVFEPPKLGDPKELFEYYSDKINAG